MSAASVLLHVLKLLIAMVFTGWLCIWILKPTQMWKRSWHRAEDAANKTVIRYVGLNVMVFCYPILAVAALEYAYMHLRLQKGRTRHRAIWRTNFANPVVLRSPIGIITRGELLGAALFAIFLSWTFYFHISSDLRKIAPSKFLHLSRWQLKVMNIGIRLGSLSEVCLAVLLLPVLRGMALLKLVGLQFEASVRYHMWLGNLMMLLSTLHGGCIMFIWASKGSLLTEIVKWQSMGRVNLAGAITLLTGLVILITSLPQIRRKQFQLFYSIHHLYIVFITFFLFHGGDRHFYLVFAGVLLLALDKILRIIQSRPTKCIIAARLLPCKAIELTLSKSPRMEYKPTSMIFIKVPIISQIQWHPFSITSSSCADDEKMSIIIKCQGQWTSALYNHISSMLDSDAATINCLPIAIEGPYGPTSNLYQRYKEIVLIAGGSGITPFLSILQELSSNSRNSIRNPVRILLIHVVKKSLDLSMLLPITKLADSRLLKLRIFVTQEEGSSAAIEELVRDKSQMRIVSFDTKGSMILHPKGLPWMATLTVYSSVVFVIALVYFNHAFMPIEKHGTEMKNPSWVTDLLVIASFIVAISSSAMITAFSSWMKSKNLIATQKQVKDIEMRSIDSMVILQEHEIIFGRRPNLDDELAELSTQTEESEVGVFVCGPDSMQEEVASFCKSYSQKLTKDRKNEKFCFNYHSINFSL